MFTRTESFKEFIRYYPIVSFIVFIHIILYLLTVIPVFPAGWVLETFAGVNLYIVQGEIWRLFTPIILHSGFPHMLFNSFSLVLFGPALERMLGKTRFILLYLAAGISANIATLLLKPLTYIHVGSSGAIFGLFGFFAAIAFFRRELLSRQNSQIILTITIIGIIMTFVQPNINVTAHVFGLISGFLIGYLTLKNKHTARSRQHGSGNWKRVHPSLKGMSPARLLIFGGIIILALLGLLTR